MNHPTNPDYYTRLDAIPFGYGDTVRVDVGPGRSASHEMMVKVYDGGVGTVDGFYWDMAGVGKRGRRRHYVGAYVKFTRIRAMVPFRMLVKVDPDTPVGIPEENRRAFSEANGFPLEGDDVERG